ncbi:MAG: ComEC family competence protein [Chitinophagaceae bacterium]|nr:ComEC family competence protein [Chitinophagaceae bacterium]
MPLNKKDIWQTAPFVRLLVPFIAGILLGYYCSVSTKTIQIFAIFSILLLLIFSILSLTAKFRWRHLSGIAIHLLMILFGAALCNHQGLQKDADWIGYRYQLNDPVLVCIQEPLTQKTKSCKSIAKIIAVQHQKKWIKAKGYLLLYFKNSVNNASINVGDSIILLQAIQRIISSGNPGSFDYQKYCALQQIHYQSFLSEKGYLKINSHINHSVLFYLYKTRDDILTILRKAVPGTKEKSVAEALLIGYKDDLDKTLLRSYSNTGVVHIIAISGLHLAMIYGLLIWLLKPFGNKKWTTYSRSAIIFFVLWGFSFITGGAAAILRSAVTFSFMLISNCLGYKNNTINALAASAFCLLVYNPFLLWDIGFQLSYAAVLSIILYGNYISNWFYFKNKLLQKLWQLNAVTLSAQILTLPIILYQFHQFPNLFLFSNFIVVPLSGFVLYAEILVLLFSPFNLLMNWMGSITAFLIGEMNGVIERTSRIPFALTENIHMSLVQTILLYAAIIAIVYWLLQKKRQALYVALSLLSVIQILNCFYFYESSHQKRLVVYQIPKQSFLEIYSGTKYFAWTNANNNLSTDIFQRTILPSRKMYRVEMGKNNNFCTASEQLIRAGLFRIQLIDSSFKASEWPLKQPADLVIITGNPIFRMTDLVRIFDCKNYVADCSNPVWKIHYWKKDAKNLHLQLHSVPEEGAFIIDLQQVKKIQHAKENSISTYLRFL